MACTNTVQLRAYSLMLSSETAEIQAEVLAILY